MDSTSEAEESQPNPGQPLVDLTGKKIGHGSQPDIGQAAKEIDVIRLSQKPATHRTLYPFRLPDSARGQEERFPYQYREIELGTLGVW